MTVRNKFYNYDGDSALPKPEHWTKDSDGHVIVACEHGNHALINGRGDDKDWTIASDGKVHPSIYWRGTCECHIWLKLENWKP